MLWLYHDSSTLSTPPQGGPESLRPHLHNYLQINGKKCNFLYDAQSALRADSQRGLSGSFSTVHYQR